MDEKIIAEIIAEILLNLLHEDKAFVAIHAANALFLRLDTRVYLKNHSWNLSISP